MSCNRLFQEREWIYAISPYLRLAPGQDLPWAPSAGRVMTEMFSKMKDVTIKGDLVTLRGRMKDSDIPALEALADAILG